MPQYRIPAFGSLNTFIEDYLLSPGQASELIDARVGRGSIEPVNTPAATTSVPKALSLNPKGDRDLVKFGGVFYFTNHIDPDDCGSELGFLGIEPPTVLPKVVPEGKGDFEGKYRYAITFETADNFESAPFRIDQIGFSVEVSGDKTGAFDEVASTWNADIAYAAGDIVTLDGRTYRAKVGHDNTETVQTDVTFQLRRVVITDFDRIGGLGGGGIRNVETIVVDGPIVVPFDPSPTVEVQKTSVSVAERERDFYITRIRGLRPIPGNLPVSIGPPILLLFTGTDVTGNFFQSFEYNDKRRQVGGEFAVFIDSRPGSGNNFENYWTEITSDVSGGSERFRLTAIPVSLESFVVRRIIYRTIANGGTFYRLDTIEDNTTTDFLDSTPDIELQLRSTITTINAHPPIEQIIDGDSVRQCGKFLTERNGIFFQAVNDRLYNSEAANPHAWNPDNFIAVDDDITAIARLDEGLLVFSKNRTFLILGDSPATFIKREVATDQGCPEHRTIAYVGNTPVWVSNDGICIWFGQAGVQVISDGFYILDFTPLFAVSSNDVYYAFGATKATAIDFRRNRAFYERNLVGYDNAFGDRDQDKLFLQRGIITEIDGEGPVAEASYRTPAIDVEDKTRIKHFRQMWIDVSADATIEVSLDGTLKQTIDSKGTERRRHRFVSGLMDQQIQFRVKTKGVIKELSTEFSEFAKQ